MDGQDLPPHLLGEELRPNAMHELTSNHVLPILVFTVSHSTEHDTGVQSQPRAGEPEEFSSKSNLGMKLSFWSGLPQVINCRPCRSTLDEAGRAHTEQFLRDQTGPVDLTDEFLRESTLRLLRDVTWSARQENDHFRNGHYSTLISVEEANLAIDDGQYTLVPLVLTSREALSDILRQRGIVIFRLPDEDGRSTAIVTLNDSSDGLEEDDEVELYQTLERAPLQDHWLVNAVTRMISGMRAPESEGANQGEAGM